MKKLPFIILILSSIFYKSQTNRFFYELKSRVDSTQEYRNNIMVLDVNPNSIKFYDKDLLDSDSINVNSMIGTSSKTNTSTDQLIVRKPNSFKNTQYRDFFDYFVIQSNDEMEWKLFKDTQDYDGYTLQKATSNFGGRNWTAWFSNEIAISEGPYKFRGLPGLIFLLTDSTHDFVYKLIKNKKLDKTYDTTNFLERHYGVEPIKISDVKFNKYLIDVYKNPMRD